jgi:hypothetical protein
LWAVSLAYAGEFSGFRLAAKVAYGEVTDAQFRTNSDSLSVADDTTGCVREATPAGSSTHREVDCNHWVAGASVLHVPTGLFLSGGYVDFTDNNRTAAFDDNDTAWWVHGGIEQKYFAIGKTTLYGEYGEQENGNVLAGFGGTTMSFWGLGLVQSIDAAAMDLYLFYRNFSSELPPDTPSPNPDVLLNGIDGTGQDLQLIGAGAIIRF